MPIKITLSRTQDRDIARLWKTGKTNLTALAEDYGVSRETIKRSLKRTKSDLTLIQTGNSPSPIRSIKIIRRVIIDYREKEMSLSELSAKYEASVTFIRKLLLQNCVSIRPQIKVGNLETRKLKRIWDLWNVGKSSKAIANVLHIPRYQVGLVIVNKNKRTPRVTKMCNAIIKNDSEVPYNEIRPIITQSNLLGDCTICGKRELMHVDHCHTSGYVRGLLCGPCNRGLGMFKDKIQNLRNAIIYLKA